jgi:hypothetical protein
MVICCCKKNNLGSGYQDNQGAFLRSSSHGQGLGLGVALNLLPMRHREKPGMLGAMEVSNRIKPGENDSWHLTRDCATGM